MWIFQPAVKLRDHVWNRDGSIISLIATSCGVHVYKIVLYRIHVIGLTYSVYGNKNYSY